MRLDIRSPQRMVYAKYSAEVCNFFVHNIMLMYPKTAGDSIKNRGGKK